MPRVSIITPVHNAEAFLGEAIASVQAQTETDWELIVVDDGSTDDSLAIAEAAARDDGRIRSVSRPDGRQRGAAAARNAGLACATGEFIAFLDADDLYEPTKLAFELTLFARHPQAAMVYGPTQWWRDGEHPWRWVEPMHREAGRLHMPPALVSKVILSLDWHVPCTCGVLIRRSAINEVGGFEERFTLYEDQTLWTKLFLRYPVFVHAHCLARYRQHEASVSAAATKSGEYKREGNHHARAAFLDWSAEHISAMNLTAADVLRALRLARAPYAAPGPQRSLDMLYLRLKRLVRRLRRLPARAARALLRTLRRRP